jgi:hypothetical protein
MSSPIPSSLFFLVPLFSLSLLYIKPPIHLFSSYFIFSSLSLLAIFTGALGLASQSTSFTTAQSIFSSLLRFERLYLSFPFPFITRSNFFSSQSARLSCTSSTQPLFQIISSLPSFSPSSTYSSPRFSFPVCPSPHLTLFSFFSPQFYSHFILSSSFLPLPRSSPISRPPLNINLKRTPNPFLSLHTPLLLQQ